MASVLLVLLYLVFSYFYFLFVFYILYYPRSFVKLASLWPYAWAQPGRAHPFFKAKILFHIKPSIFRARTNTRPKARTLTTRFEIYSARSLPQGHLARSVYVCGSAFYSILFLQPQVGVDFHPTLPQPEIALTLWEAESWHYQLKDFPTTLII